MARGKASTKPSSTPLAESKLTMEEKVNFYCMQLKMYENVFLLIESVDNLQQSFGTLQALCNERTKAEQGKV
jgi:hypothetical protein